jgi:hypothetical protein
VKKGKRGNGIARWQWPWALKVIRTKTFRRERIGRKIGHLGDQDIARLNVALAFVIGLAD